MKMKFWEYVQEFILQKFIQNFAFGISEIVHRLIQ